MAKPLTAGEKIARDLCEMDAPIDNIIEVDPVDVARRIDEVVNAHNRLECYSTGIKNDIIESFRSVAEKSLAGLSTLKEENESLKLDAERWRMLSALMFLGNVECTQDADGGYRIELDPAENMLGVSWEGNSPEEAIDAAMIAGDKNVLD